MTDILLIEDNDLLSQAYYMILKKSGYRVTVARNGQEGLEKLKEHKPQIVLLDMLMPVMNGVEFLKRYNSNQEYTGLKIVLLSNVADEPVVKQAMALGATTYVLKSSMGPGQLVSLIRGLEIA
jgi:CheY-like chemotaxis protein